MCGIFGFTGPSDRELAARSLALLAHRGPDAAHSCEMPEITLGATRLSIVGVANGRQPLVNEAGDVVAVVNGELYNYAPLRNELERRGHRFATDTDGEVLVHLYEEEGDALLARIEGIFAFALWDARRSRLLLARDPMGVKPLFWTERGGRFRFASEIKALLADPGLPRELDRRSLDGLLALGFVPGARTLFAGIRRLAPGHSLVREGTKLDISPYWRLEVDGSGAVDGDPVTGFLGRLERAVESQLAHEVPMGFGLSGGIDSSLVVAVARRLVGAPVRTFAIGAAGRNDERPWAREVATHCATDHVEIELGGRDLLARLPCALWHAEEPRAGPLIAQHLFYEQVARSVRVLIVGEGADELLGGYPRLKTACGAAAWLSAPLARRAYSAQSPLLFGRRRIHSDAWLASLERPTLDVALLEPVFAVRGVKRRERLLAFEQAERLPPTHLTTVDRMSMAHSVEARVPYLDRSLVEYVNRLPMSWKLRAQGEKRLLREAARTLLPESIRLRPKYGNRDPIALWLRSGLADLADRWLDPATVAARGIWKPAMVDGLRTRSRRSRRRPFDDMNLFRMVQIELWHRLFIDPTRLEPPASRSEPAP